MRKISNIAHASNGQFSLIWLVLAIAVIPLLLFGCVAEVGEPELPVPSHSFEQEEAGNSQPHSLEQEGADTSPTLAEPEQNQDETRPETEYIRITPEEARDMMTDDVVILDVRSQEEFDSGHIKDAILLPHDVIRERANSVLTDKNQTILVYCQAGRRSEIASRALIEMGYTSVFDFGGINEWQQPNGK